MFYASAHYFLSVHQNGCNGGVTDHGVAVYDDHIAVLANLQGTYPVGNAQMLGRIDGDGLKGGEGVHACLDGQPGR